MLRSICMTKNIILNGKNLYQIATHVSTNSFLVQVPKIQFDLKQFYSVKKSKGGSKEKFTKPKVELRKEEIDTVIDYSDLLKQMKDAIEHLKKDFNNNLNLRVSTSSYEEIPVKTSSGNVKLGELAQVEVKSSNMYVIDLIHSPDHVKPVFEAIVRSKLNANPQCEKTTIYLPIAKITREHREAVSKTAKLKSEQAIKKIRDVESKALRKAKDAKHVSSDLIHSVSEHIKFQYDNHVKEAHAIRDAKIKEILQAD